MKRPSILFAMCGVGFVALTTHAHATSFVPRDDFAVVALDARSGEHIWTHYPDKLSKAITELHSDGLVVNGLISTVDPEATFTEVLDPATGKLLDKPAPQDTPLAVSATRAHTDVVLDNGWKLSFHQGYDEKLNFLDAQGKIAWTIPGNGFPDDVTSWHNFVFWNKSFPDETMMYAYEAGDTTPKWTFDPQTLVTITEEHVYRLYFEVRGDEIYVGLHEHLFLLDPATGVVKKQWDLSALTGVPFFAASLSTEGFFGGGYEFATVAATPETIVLGFEGQIVALDRPSGDLLWHANSHTVPYNPNPMMHDQLLVVTAHENLAGPRPEPPPPPPPPTITPTGCAFVGPFDAAPGNGHALLIVGIGLVLRWSRRRFTTRS